MDISRTLDKLDAMPRDAHDEILFKEGCDLLRQHPTYMAWKSKCAQLKHALTVLKDRHVAALAVIKSGTSNAQTINECRGWYLMAKGNVEAELWYLARSRAGLEASEIFMACQALAKQVQNGAARLDDITKDDTKKWVQEMQAVLDEA